MNFATLYINLLDKNGQTYPKIVCDQDWFNSSPLPLPLPLPSRQEKMNLKFQAFFFFRVTLGSNLTLFSPPATRGLVNNVKLDLGTCVITTRGHKYWSQTTLVKKTMVNGRIIAKKSTM